ncbi:S-adenosyl-L-methionine-dependent methyltransferase [Nemania abortiva]|nr:S-adenosyl-L-methionine-dependent methyltransferase [Nemania abortiva]
MADVVVLAEELLELARRYSDGKAKPEANIFELREKIRAKAKSVSLAIDGPEQAMKTIARGFVTCTALRICLDLGLASHLPLNEERSLDELSDSCGADKALIRPVIRLLSQHGIFEQTGSTTWQHSELSRVITDASFASWMTSILEEKYRSVAYLPRFLQETEYQFPSPGKTAYNAVYNTPLDFYTFSSKFDQARALDYAYSMENLARAQLPFFEKAYPLESLDQSTHFIDVAGGLGNLSCFLAERFPKASFEVQDHEFIVGMGKRNCPESLRNRISFRVHDMLLPQPEVNRDGIGSLTFLLKIILHDHNDDQCGKILNNLLAAMGENDRILIIDTVIQEIGGSLSSSFSDMIQLSMFGSGHRTLTESLELINSCRGGLAVRTFSGGDEEHDGMMVLEIRMMRTKTGNS